MSSNQIKIVLQIDNVEVSFSSTDFLYQEEPYPDGHNFTLCLEGNNIIKHFKGFGVGQYHILDRHDTQDVFWNLNALSVNFKLRDGSSALKYFLNNIHSLELLNDSVEITGICSKIMIGI